MVWFLEIFVWSLEGLLLAWVASWWVPRQMGGGLSGQQMMLRWEKGYTEDWGLEQRWEGALGMTNTHISLVSAWAALIPTSPHKQSMYLEARGKGHCCSVSVLGALPFSSFRPPISAKQRRL